eukprot:TRINITY_DN2685_c0_g1_i18.p1 TRINITY_DN2685_c0_g1~~TRINITY_DN2685_c0_g1_i18.p1  ORF type:complete len:1121 (-),score=225.46 TRINITY_DN2685_c0_g1_i18:300-3626(-)
MPAAPHELVVAAAAVVVVVVCGLAGGARALFGDEELALAYEAALISMYEDGTVQKIMTDNDVLGYVELSDCAREAAVYEYPNASAGGTLANVLARGYAVIGARANFTSTGWSLYSTTTTPSGAAPDVEQEVVRRIGLHYGVNLTVKYNLNFMSTDTVMSALDAATIDVSACNYGIGTFSGTVRRACTYRYSCATMAEHVYMVSTVSSGIASGDNLLASIDDANGQGQAKIGAVGTTTFQAIQQIFDNAVVVQFLSDTQALAALRSDPSFLAVAAFKYATASEVDLSWYSLEFILPRTAFFRKENLPKYKVANVSACATWETGNQALSQVYNAALVWMEKLGIHDDTFLRYNITLANCGDCVAKEGAYTLPTTVEGTLKKVISTHTLTIGLARWESLPFIDNTGEVPIGALPEVERYIATWLSRQYSSFDPIQVVYSTYNTSAQIFDALEDGNIDVTSAFMSVGGSYHSMARTQQFIPSCFTTSVPATFFTVASLQITSQENLTHYLSTHNGLYLGAVGTGNVQVLQMTYGNLVAGVKDFLGASEAFAQLVVDPSMVAILLDWMPGPPADYVGRVNQGMLNFVTPNCAFFRKDKVAACGDSYLDVSLGEQCDSGEGCILCRCSNSFMPTMPASTQCLLVHGGGSQTKRILVAALVGSIVPLSLALTVGLICLAVIIKYYRTQVYRLMKVRPASFNPAMLLSNTPAMKAIESLQELKKKKKLTSDDKTILDQIISLLASDKMHETDYLTKRKAGKIKVDAEIDAYFTRNILGNQTALDSEIEESSSMTFVLQTGPVVAPGIAVLGGSGMKLGSIIPEVELGNWDFNVLSHDRETALVDVALAVFQSHDLLSKFNVDLNEFTEWLHLISSAYKDNPCGWIFLENLILYFRHRYHNSLHAAEVLQAMHYFIINFGRQRFSDLQLLAAFFAAVCHDIGHPGLNNNFLMNTLDELAITYNGISILENFHVSKAFHLLFGCPDNWLQKCLSPLQVLEFHSIVTRLVLATDMAKHVEIISQALSRIAGGQSLDPVVKADAQLILQVFIKAADIGNSCRPWRLCERWAQLVAKEFCHQGDLEKRQGLAVSPFMVPPKYHLYFFVFAFYRVLQHRATH